MASVQADGITFAKPRSFRVLTTLLPAHKECLRGDLVLDWRWTLGLRLL